MGFEGLDRLRCDIEKYSKLATEDDKKGFRLTQKLSVKIMQIEHGIISSTQLHELENVYRDYFPTWREHILNSSKVIRNFSVSKADEIESSLAKVEKKITKLQKEMKNLPDEVKIELPDDLIFDIKSSAHDLSSLADTCIVDIEYIKKEWKEILAIL